MPVPDPCLSQIYACPGSMPVPDPCLSRIHACPGSMPVPNPCLSRIHACPESMPVPDPCLSRIHACPGSMPVPDLCLSQIHACPRSQARGGRLRGLHFWNSPRTNPTGSQKVNPLAKGYADDPSSQQPPYSNDFHAAPHPTPAPPICQRVHRSWCQHLWRRGGKPRIEVRRWRERQR